jgi:S-adenosylmethionine decarboxylase
MTSIEWIVEAHGCPPERLNDLAIAHELFARIIRELDLRVVGDTQWHQFPTTGGITGLSLLTESHLAIHTFPEFGSLCLNLFCCVARPEWDFEAACRQLFAAARVTVRRVPRGYVSEASALEIIGTGARE